MGLSPSFDRRFSKRGTESPFCSATDSKISNYANKDKISTFCNTHRWTYNSSFIIIDISLTWNWRWNTKRIFNKIIIPEKSMKELIDCSKMRTDKQVTKLAKDGVIFLRAPTNNNQQRSNAMKLRNVIIKLLEKYQFTQRIPHPKYDISVNINMIFQNQIRTHTQYIHIYRNQPSKRTDGFQNMQSNQLNLH